MPNPMPVLSAFVLASRKSIRLTQAQLAAKAGVSVRFVIALEGGKQTLRLDAVNKVLRLFGKTAGPVELPRED